MSNFKGFANRILYSEKDSEKLEKYMCIRDMVEDLSLGPQTIPETPVGIWHAICRCQLNIYHAKRKPYVNMAEMPSYSVGQGSFKMDCFKGGESKLYILVGNHSHRVLRAKEEGNLPACAYSMGSLHVL